jgi:hypothetical protein
MYNYYQINKPATPAGPEAASLKRRKRACLAHLRKIPRGRIARITGLDSPALWQIGTTPYGAPLYLRDVVDVMRGYDKPLAYLEYHRCRMLTANGGGLERSASAFRVPHAAGSLLFRRLGASVTCLRPSASTASIIRSRMGFELLYESRCTSSANALRQAKAALSREGHAAAMKPSEFGGRSLDRREG